ncbi:MAG: hypothetical protein Q8L02_07370 [Candidatus Nitrotoga sp.]|nr:hypothetical protein [Candidatus Nitrotoga sp.]
MKKEFEIKSSDGVTSYVVEFVLEAGKLHVYCGCPAGVFGKWCKHKMQLMTGDMSGACAISGADDMVELQTWISKSEFARLLVEMKLAENEMREAKTKMDRTKKALEKAAQKGMSI